ncbi:MAG: phage tail protein [Lachnospiraceae bacterium]|nr:phage tail protein [Lachnospiraceae bacterium]
MRDTPRLFKSTDNDFTGAGLGYLTELTSAKITEELNGSYTLEASYPFSGALARNLVPGVLIVAKPNLFDAPQAFRVTQVLKNLDGTLNLLADHISYDLCHIYLSPFSASSLAGAITALADGAPSNDFSFSTDISSAASIDMSAPVSVRSALGGVEGSLIDTYGGELRWNNWRVHLLKARGSDRGVTIQYAHNLTALEQKRSIESSYDCVFPFATVDDVVYYLTDTTVAADAPLVYADTSDYTLYDYPRAYLLDLSENFEVGDVPTQAQLKSYAETYIAGNKLPEETLTATVSFIDLQTIGGGSLPIMLGDTVRVDCPNLDIFGLETEVNKTVYNVLLDRYDSIDVGQRRVSLSDDLAALEGASVGSAGVSAGGAVKESDAMSAAVTLATGTWATYSGDSNMPSLTLSPGSWVISCKAIFSANTSGCRILGIDSSDDHTTIDIRIAPSPSATTQVTYSKVVRHTSDTTYYLSAFQNSGSSLTLSASSFLKAVRIGG